MGQGINRLRQAILQNKSGLERAALPNPALPPVANQYSMGDFRMADKQNAEKYKVSTGDFRMADKANTDTAVRKYGTNFTALPQNMGVSSDKTLDERIKALENEQRTLGLNTRTMNVTAGQAKFDKYTELEAEINRLKDQRGDGMSLGEHFAYGTGRTLEGLASAGNAIVHGSADLLYGGLGKVTGVFGKNDVSDWFYDQAQKSSESDLFGEKKISETIERDFGDKLTDADRISGGLIKSGSSLLGNVAAGSLAGLASGAGALSSASTMASKAIFGTGAYRSGVQEALSEGANIEDATAYGALSATLSLAVENIASGIPGLDNTNSITSKILNKLKNTPQALKTLTGIIGEGGEEVLEALISPYLQRITYNPDAETATLNELTQAFASGTILSGLMQGGNITAGKLADVTTPQTAQPSVNLPPVQTTAQPIVNSNLPPVQTQTNQPSVNLPPVQTAEQQLKAQENKIAQLEHEAEMQRAVYISLYSEYQVGDVETRRPELISEAQAQKQVVEQAEAKVEAAKKELAQMQKTQRAQALKQERATLKQEQETAKQNRIAQVQDIVRPFADRYISEDALAAVRQIGELKPQVADLRKAYNEVRATNSRLNSIYKALEAASFNEAMELNTELETEKANLDNALGRLTAAQDAIINLPVKENTITALPNVSIPPTQVPAQSSVPMQSSLPIPPTVPAAQPIVNSNLPPVQTAEQTQPDVQVNQQTEVQQPVAVPSTNADIQGKAAEYLRRAERRAEAQIGKALSVPSGTNKEYLRPAIDGMTHEYLRTGDISTETANRVFDTTYPIGNTSNEYIQDTKYEFNKALDEFKTDLRNVKRYSDQRAAELKLKEQDIQVAGKDLEAEQIERIKNLWKTVKEAKRASEKAVALNLLTDEDNAIVNRLLRNEIKLEDIPKTANYKGIKEVYEAKKAYNAAIAPIAQFNNNRKNALLAEADEFLTNAHTWKDKTAGFLYSRETMERNIRDIVPDKDEADTIIEHYIKPVHQNEAERTRMKNTYRDRVRSLNLSRKVVKGNTVSEAYAVQFLGEAEDNISAIEASKGRISERNGGTITDWKAAIDDLYKNNPNLDYGKIKNAVAEFRNIYNELFDQMNEARIRNGYEPVDYRRGYFPHFTAEKTDGLMAALTNALGVNMEVTALPTSINGITHTFRPGIRWSGNILRRTGFETAYDAVEGLDRYIEGISDVIHHTGDIQKLRALSDQIRYKYSDDNIKKEVSDIRARTDISDAEKQSLIEDKLKNANTTLSNFVVELEEYTNLLANKRAFGDRSAERKMGRNAAYNIMKAVTNRVAANMVAVNPASWLTNFIPLTQGWGGLKTTHLLNGMWDTLKAYKTDDGFVDRSTFLTNRRGSDPIVRTWTQSATAAMGKGMEYIDYFTADSLVRARYYQNLQEGLGEVAAMEEADSWVASVMADRSKGSLPTLFEERNPATKIFTQFQLEVNNQLSHLLKDIPRSYRDKGTKALAAALMKFFFGAFLYNELYEKLIGRRPALDPIGILADTTNALQEGFTQAGTSLAKNIAEDMPFIGGLIGGGRLPISSALPDVGRLWSAGSGLLSGEMDEDKALHTLGREILKPAAYILPPFGGGQIKKAAEGISAVASSGSYSVDSQGRDILQYPIYNPNLPQTAANYARSVMFGKSSLPGAQDWIESGFKSSSARETAVYKELVEMGSDAEKVYSTLEAIAAAEKTDEITGAQAKRDVLAASDLSNDEKYVVYYGLLATDNEKEIMDMLPDKGEIYAGISEMSRVDPDTVREYIEVSGITERQAFDLHREINTLKPNAGTSVTTHQKISVILSQNLSAKQKADLVGTFFTANDKEGNIKTEALLPYLDHTARLLTLYKDTGDSEIISMKVPEEFFFTPKNAKISTKYELTETEKKLFKDTFIKFYNGYISKDTTAAQAKKIRSAAYEAAKIAVVQRRRG